MAAIVEITQTDRLFVSVGRYYSFRTGATVSAVGRGSRSVSSLMLLPNSGGRRQLSLALIWLGLMGPFKGEIRLTAGWPFRANAAAAPRTGDRQPPCSLFRWLSGQVRAAFSRWIEKHRAQRTFEGQKGWLAARPPWGAPRLGRLPGEKSACSCLAAGRFIKGVPEHHTLPSEQRAPSGTPHPAASAKSQAWPDCSIQYQFITSHFDFISIIIYMLIYVYKISITYIFSHQDINQRNYKYISNTFLVINT